jgi:hypothetical protein
MQRTCHNYHSCILPVVTETNRIQLVRFSMQNRSFGPYLTAMNRILVPVMHGVSPAFKCMRSSRYAGWPEAEASVLKAVHAAG